jgi:hypothetical protein
VSFYFCYHKKLYICVWSVHESDIAICEQWLKWKNTHICSIESRLTAVPKFCWKLLMTHLKRWLNKYYQQNSRTLNPMGRHYRRPYLYSDLYTTKGSHLMEKRLSAFSGCGKGYVSEMDASILCVSVCVDLEPWTNKKVHPTVAGSKLDLLLCCTESEAGDRFAELEGTVHSSQWFWE